MCGIAGIFGQGAVEHIKVVDRMINSMAHRGPDGEGIYVSPSGLCVLGHRRLAVIDLSDAAAQPMVSSDGRYVLVYNGECYNYQELREELYKKGEHFDSNSDTEVILKLLVKDGTSILPKLNAMFALAMWEERNQTLFLARDRYGQKPLYFAHIGNLVLFASEVRAILASGLVSRTADPRAIHSYLAYGAVQEPFTIVAGVSILKPGSFIIFEPGGNEKTESYWTYPAEKKNVSPLQLRDSFVTATKRHLISDAPLGLFLSGGIDSSAVVAAAARSVDNLKTLSVVFPDQPTQSEAAYATMVAAKAQTTHHEVAITGQKMLKILPEAIEAMDQPTGDAINTFIVSRAAYQIGLKVALSGLGSDELFGGYYSSFRDMPRILRIRYLFALIRNPAANFIEYYSPFSIKTSKLAEIFDSPKSTSCLYLVTRRVFSSRQIKRMAPELVNGGWDSGLCAHFLHQLETLVEGRNVHDAIGLLEMCTYMGQTLLRDSDVMGMAHGVELRLPFLDAEFSSCALSLESKARTPRKCPKWRFVNAMGDWLPSDVVNRPKMGFTLPIGDWMQRELKQEIIEGIMALPTACKQIRQDVLLEFWERFRAQPKKIGWFRPWILFVLGHYLQKYRLEI